MTSTRGAKQKGRRLQNSVALKFRELFKEILTDDDIKPAIMGESGKDIKLSPLAKKIIAFDIETKNQESLVGAALTKAINQCESNTENGRIPLLIFKKNLEPERIILRLDYFLELIYPNGDISFTADNTQQIIIELEKMKGNILKYAKR
jgi:hypothetical protein